MSEQERVNRSRTSQQFEDEQEEVLVSRGKQDEAFDALLDEIDGLLETNAAEYVRSFVQKGGQ